MFVSYVHKRVVEGSGEGIAVCVVYVDVHGVCCVVGGCNVVATEDHGEKSGDISGSIISTLRNLTRILIRILILLLGGLLVLLTFIELLTNHGSGTGVQGMATAANITRSERKRY